MTSPNYPPKQKSSSTQDSPGSFPKRSSSGSSLGEKPSTTCRVEEQDLPQISRSVRRLLVEIAKSIGRDESCDKAPSEVPPKTTLCFSGLSIRYKRRRVQWDGPNGGGKLKLPKSKIKPAVRSLLDKNAGQVFVAGFQYVSWDQTAEEVTQEATEKGVLLPREQQGPETTSHRITQLGLRNHPQLSWRLLDDSLTVRICLSNTGRHLTQLAYAKHLEG